jgi:general secretion pathway protein B
MTFMQVRPPARCRPARLVPAAAAAALALGAGAAFAQVTPAEPFGGRPFGAPVQADPPARVPPNVVPPGSVLVLPPPGGPAVMGGAPAVPGVLVQPAPGAVAVQPQAVPPPPAQAPAGVPSPGLRGNVTQGSAPPSQPSQPQSQSQSQPQPQPQPQGQAADTGNAAPGAAPQSMAPPFAGNRAPVGPQAAAAGGTQPPVKGLPPDAPRLVISGGVHSSDPARRLLIVNGQVFREGADLGSGVVLQEVGRDSAVLGFRGERYNVYF